MADKEKDSKPFEEQFINALREDDQGDHFMPADEEVPAESKSDNDSRPLAKPGPDSALDGLLTTIDDEITKFLKMVNSGTSPKGPASSSDTDDGRGAGQQLVEFDDSDQLGEWETERDRIVAEVNREYDEIDLDELVAAIDEEVEVGTGSSEEYSASREQGFSEDEQQFIIFTLAGTEYAVPAANVTEVAEMLRITPLPNVPHWLKGVANLRGDIISIVDLRTFLKLESGEETINKRLLITRAGEAEIVVGLVVDRVNA
ncbi:MAG: chemotaxis protein CheW, partial [Desulfobulbaceae bacterium]|nr:chemotaxis protein CheW [Desulfobulbaceae bacterium]